MKSGRKIIKAEGGEEVPTEKDPLSISRVDSQAIGQLAAQRMKSEQDAKSNDVFNSKINQEIQTRVNAGTAPEQKTSFGDKIGSAMSSVGGQIALGAADAAASAINSQSKVDTNETQQAAKNAITSAISMIPG